jgi:hypothetical protein
MQCRIFNKVRVAMLKLAAVGAIALSGLILSTAGPAQAQVLNDTLVNGPSVTVSALLAAGGGFSYPSVFGLRANSGECVRVEATNASFDAEFTIVGPDGQVYRDNDSGPGTLPLVKIGGTPDTGVYTLVINSANGAAVASGTVTFTYGRFSGGAGSPNCMPPTSPL